MKINEVRIGNYRGNTHRPVPIDASDFMNMEVNDLNYPSILLNEEWLKKFGFEATEVWGDYANDKLLICSGPYFQEYYCTYNNNFRSKQIKYVHELQNLYFALTGEELQLKEL